MGAVGIVACFFDFEFAAGVTHFLERLTGHAQVIFGLSYAGAAGVPFHLEFLLFFVEADFFGAEDAQLLRQFFRLAGHRRGLFVDGLFLLPEHQFAALEVHALFIQALGHRFGQSEPLVHRGKFGLCR